MDYKQFFNEVNNNISVSKTSKALRVLVRRLKKYLIKVKNSTNSIEYKKIVERSYKNSLTLINNKLRQI